MFDMYDKIILLVELGNEYCQLNHGPRERRENHPAVDYVICPLGYRKGDREMEEKHLAIPVCRCCVEGLHDEEWTLLYCLNCLASQWILRPVARLRYRHNLIWLGSCPKCADTFGGIYFNGSRSLPPSSH